MNDGTAWYSEYKNWHVPEVQPQNTNEPDTADTRENPERPATAEIRCDFADGQSTQAHGVDGDVKCYKTQYANHTEAYMISAQWFLADAGYMISLSSYGAKPPHTMPLSVFG